ncbi:vitellogenin-1-like [Lucilia sericata]|uniref:vitellogenin-1-like n=1 Tax=Lucilia sericata TaxID=13632 RepID=UPI0018A81513|nr:vitellogenin-1-like [Lucilia sericata]
MELLSATVFLWFVIHSSSVQGVASFGITNVVDSVNGIVQGIGKEITFLLLTPSELFKASKQILFGLPETAVFKTVHKLCTLYLSSDLIKPLGPSNMDTMSFRLRTPCEEYRFPLTHTEEILLHPNFDVNKKVAIFVTGWMTSSDDSYVGKMANAFNCRGDYNFLALNSSDAIQTLYSWSAFNTEEVGNQMAQGLAKLVDKIPPENIHLIGHSLGAHIVGYTGRYFTKYTGLNISRITGLDPANPCFNEGETLTGLQRGDASFIDVIHTNPGVLGTSNSIGDIDFFVDGLAPIKPGCIKFGCSHTRAYEYFTESVYPDNEMNFMAKQCTSMARLNNGFCSGPAYPMGFAVPYDLKGNFFLSVNSQSPFGQNNNGRPAVPILFKHTYNYLSLKPEPLVGIYDHDCQTTEASVD